MLKKPNPRIAQQSMDSCRPAASVWLQAALRSTLSSNPVDDANDADVLARLLNAQCIAPARRALAIGSRASPTRVRYRTHKIDHRVPILGGSTLATQLEKIRHSPQGKTHSVTGSGFSADRKDNAIAAGRALRGDNRFKVFTSCGPGSLSN